MSTSEYVPTLCGDDEDLTFLSKCFTDENCWIVKESTSWKLKSSEFSLPENWRELPVNDSYEDEDGNRREPEIKMVRTDQNYELVQERAIEMINSMIGASALVRSNVHPVSVSSIAKFNAEGECVGAATIGHGMPTKRTLTPLHERAGLPKLMRAWVKSGLNDTAVSYVLQIYAVLPISWSRCVVVIEFITADCGQKKLAKFIDKKLLSSVTQSAHNARQPHEGPRHGKRVRKDWDPARALSLLEADSIVKRVVHRWLADKTAIHKIPI